MTSIRKFTYAVLLAVTTFNLAPALASAQQPARGKFTLTHDVRWQNAKLPAGDYVFSFNVDGVSSLLTLTKISGATASYMVLVPSTEDAKASGDKLVLETSADGSYVSVMHLPEFGMTLHFSAPAHGSEKQLAKAGMLSSAGQ
jgi:hypothetical protein